MEERETSKEAEKEKGSKIIPHILYLKKLRLNSLISYYVFIISL